MAENGGEIKVGKNFNQIFKIFRKELSCKELIFFVVGIALSLRVKFATLKSVIFVTARNKRILGCW